MTTTQSKPADLILELDTLPATAGSAHALMQGIVALLHSKLTRYNWVGFYMLEKESDRDILVLGPFKGTMTPHTRIPLNQGICGAAASSGKTVVVDDVNADSRYLACSLETKSEIVVPVFTHGASSANTLPPSSANSWNALPESHLASCQGIGALLSELATNHSPLPLLVPLVELLHPVPPL